MESKEKLLLFMKIENGGVDNFFDTYDTKENTEKSYLREYIANHSKKERYDTENEKTLYVGKWSIYIISQGQRVRVYSAIINEDNTAKWILYMPDGSINTSMVFRQCVFHNGYVYFTDNGDINIKGTPRFRLGTNGLQTANGEDLIKE